MPMKLLDTDAFRAAVKDGGAPEGTLFKFATTEPETIGDAKARTKRFVFSDATVDHSGDSIDPKGWNLSIFKRNPVALFSHMSWDPPIGRATNVKVQDGQLIGDIEFASADVYDFADTIFRLVDGGYLKAVSVGFRPDEYVFTNDKNRPYGIDFKKQTLLEISVCPVPCNPNALGEARSIGVDTRPLVDWAEKVLDSGDTVFLPRKELETLRTQAGAVERKHFVISDHALTPEQVRKIELLAGGNEPEIVTLDLAALDTKTPAGNCGREKDVECGMADPQECMVHATPVDKALSTKAGRRISAASKAKLQAAVEMSAAHHDAITKCIKDVMDDPDEEPDGDPDDDAGRQPAGSVVPAKIVDPDEHLTPEERRLKEVAALKAGLPKND